jgi:chromosome segregation ATPase
MVSTRHMRRQTSNDLGSNRPLHNSQRDSAVKQSPLETSMVVSPASSTNLTPRSLTRSLSATSHSQRLAFVPSGLSPQASNSSLKHRGHTSQTPGRRLSFASNESAWPGDSSPPLGQVAQNGQDDGLPSSHIRVPERRAFRSPSHEKRSGSDGAGGSDEVENLKLANQRKEDELRTMRQKLHLIEQGLGSIDVERSILQEKCSMLAAEKSQIQRQLSLREKEITALSRRCASQEEKMKETNQLRSKNRELTEALDRAQSTVESQKQGQDDLASLRKQLQESELARENLQRQLAKITKEHDAIVDTLHECLGNVRKLTDEKQQLDEERRREGKRAQLEMEKQRLDHVRVSNALKEDIGEQQSRIYQMERILQENMAANTSLRRERALAVNVQQEEIQRVVDKYENKLLSLETEVHESLVSMENDCETKLEEVYLQMDERDSMMIQLEMEFATQMEELMLHSTEMEKLQDDKKELEDRVASLQEMEAEHSALVDFLEVADGNLAEVTSENAYLSLERDYLYAATSELQRKIQELEQQLKRSHENRKAKESDFRDLLEAEQDELRVELSKSLSQAMERADSLRMDIYSRDREISWMEEELKVSRRNVVEQDCRLRCERNRGTTNNDTVETGIESSDVNYVLWQQELDDAQELLGLREDRLREIESEMEENERMRVELESALAASNEKIKTLESKVESESECCFSLNQKLQDARVLLDEENNRFRQLEFEFSKKEAAQSMLESHLEDAKTRVAKLEEKTSSDQRVTSSLERDLILAREAMLEKEMLIEEIETKCGEKETQLSKLESDMDTANVKVKLLEEKLASLEKDALERKSDSSALMQDILDATKEECAKKDLVISETQGTLQDAEAKVTSLEEDVSRWDEAYSLLKRDLENCIASLKQRENEMYAKQLESIQVAEKVVSLEELLEREKSNCVALTQELSNERLQLTETECRLHIIEDDNSENAKLNATLKSRLAEGNDKVDRLEKQLAFDQQKVGSLEKEVNVARQSLLQKESLVQTLERKCAEAEEAMSLLHRELADSRSILASQEKESAGWSVEKISLTSKVSSLESQLEITRASFAADTDVQNSVIEQLHLRLRKAFSTSNERYASMEEDINSWKGKYASLEENLLTVSSSLEQNGHRIQDLEVTNSEREEKLAELERTIEESHEEIFLLEIELVARESKISQQEKELSDLKGIFSNSTTEGHSQGLKEANQETEKLQNELREARNKIASLEQQVNERDSMLVEIVAVMESRANIKEQKHGDLEERVKQLEKLLQTKEAQILTLDEELGATKEKLADSTEKSNLALVKSDKVGDRVTELETLLEVKEKQLLSFGEALDATREELVDSDKKLRCVLSERESCSGIKAAILGDRVTELETLLETKESRLASLDVELTTTKDRLVDREKKACIEEQKHQQQKEKAATLAALLEEKEKQLLSLHGVLQTTKDRLVEREERLNGIAAETERLTRMEEEEQVALAGRVAQLDTLMEAQKSRLQSLETTNETLVQSEVKLREDLSRCELERASREAILLDASSRVASLEVLVENRENRLIALDQELKEARQSLIDKDQRVQTLEAELKDAHCASTQLAVQVRKMKTEIALKDDEIRDLQLFDLQDSKETIALLDAKVCMMKLEMQSNEMSSANLAVELESQVEELQARVGFLEREKADLTHRYDANVSSLELQVSLLQAESSRLESWHAVQLEQIEAQRAALISLSDKITEVDRIKTALQAAEVKVSGLENSLVGRGHLLGEVVQHNKSLESILEEHKHRVLELEESLKLCHHELAKREDEFSKGQTEIAKENKEMKDKVLRQEGHLLRRFQREKVLRERNNGSATKSPSSILNRRTQSLQATAGTISPPGESPPRKAESLNPTAKVSRFAEGLSSGRSQLRTPPVRKLAREPFNSQGS